MGVLYRKYHSKFSLIFHKALLSFCMYPSPFDKENNDSFFYQKIRNDFIFHPIVFSHASSNFKFYNLKSLKAC